MYRYLKNIQFNWFQVITYKVQAPSLSVHNLASTIAYLNYTYSGTQCSCLKCPTMGFQLCQFIRATLKCVGGLSSTLHIVLLICPVRQSKRRMYTTVCAKQATIAIGQGWYLVFRYTTIVTVTQTSTSIEIFKFGRRNW